MKTRVIGMLIGGALLFCVAAIGAQGARKLEVSFKDGLVTIDAQNVTLREIFVEWSKQGGSKVINVDKLSGPAVSYEFRGEPEGAVLRTLLRDVPGYGASMHALAPARGSIHDTIYLLAIKSPVAAPSSYPPTANQGAQPQAAPRLIQGSPDDEIPPVQRIGNSQPPSTRGPDQQNPNLQTQPGGIITSTVPGVVIPVQGVPPGGRGVVPPPIPPGGRGRGGQR